MPRVKRGPKRAQRRKKILARASGYYGTKSKAHRVAKLAVEKSLGYAYRDRRQKKRQFRRLWIVRINAGARANGLTYSRLMACLKAAGVDVNRKMLADLAVHDAAAFATLAATAREAIGIEAPPAAAPGAEAVAVEAVEPEAAADEASDDEPGADEASDDESE